MAAVASMLVAAACGSSDSSPDDTTTPENDSSAPPSKNDGALPDDDAAIDGGSDASSDAGIDADCAAAPILKDTSADDGGIACPDRTGAGTLTCTKAQQCCVPGTTGAPSFCVTQVKTNEANNDTAFRFVSCLSQDPNEPAAWNSAEKTNAAYECVDTTACPNALPFCCATPLGNDGGALGLSAIPNVPEACGAKQFTNIGGSRCASICKSGEVQLCSAKSGCSGSATCRPVTAARALGYCAP